MSAQNIRRGSNIEPISLRVSPVDPSAKSTTTLLTNPSIATGQREEIYLYLALRTWLTCQPWAPTVYWIRSLTFCSNSVLVEKPIFESRSNCVRIVGHRDARIVSQKKSRFRNAHGMVQGQQNDANDLLYGFRMASFGRCGEGMGYGMSPFVCLRRGRGWESMAKRISSHMFWFH